jgi:nucleoid DNA-binding protein
MERNAMSKTTTKPETLGIPELSASLAEAHDLTKARAKAILDSLRDEIVQALLAGKRVNLFGLGTYEVRATKEKMGRNPKTGEKIAIPAGRKVVFKVAKGLKDQM